MFFKIGVLKLTGKHLCWSLLLIRPSGLQHYQKETSAQVFSCDILRIFEEGFLYNTSDGCFCLYQLIKKSFILSDVGEKSLNLFFAITNDKKSKMKHSHFSPGSLLSGTHTDPRPVSKNNHSQNCLNDQLFKATTCP